MTNTWEPNRDVLDVKENKIPSTTTPISSFNYRVNNIGQRTGVTTTGTAFPSQPADWTWGYDALGQVISANSPTAGFDRAYEYDQIGNRQRAAAGTLDVNDPSATVYEPNPLNQYDAIGAFAPTYDADGNQKDAQILPLGSSSLVPCVYRWDAENRLIAVKDTNGADIVSYVYDSQSRRIARRQDGNVTLYLYDGWNCLAEYLTSDLQTFDLKTAYTWGLDLSGSLQGAGGVGGLLSVTKHQAQSTTHYFPTFDGNGNISEYLTTTGIIVAHYEYDPFGRTIVASGDDAADFAYRFSTKPVDVATGLYYYGYRWYDTDTGRWINRDPIEERGGVNLYGFVGNRPLVEIDWLGMCHFSGRVVYVSLYDSRAGQTDCRTGDRYVADPNWRPGGGGSGSGAGGDFFSAISKLVPIHPQIEVNMVSPPILVGIIGPVNVFAKGGIVGAVGNCKRPDGTCGVMFVGSVFVAIDACAGTPPSDAIRTGTFRSGPRVGQRYFKDFGNGSKFVKDYWPAGVESTVLSKLPDCETDIDFKGSLKAYINLSYLIGESTINGDIGECSLRNGCKWTLEASVQTKFSINKPGFRAGVEFVGAGEGKLSL